ncbi:MAG: hypothetical protein V3S85_01530, partial [Nitrospirales bacterium]
RPIFTFTKAPSPLTQRPLTLSIYYQPLRIVNKELCALCPLKGSWLTEKIPDQYDFTTFPKAP